MGPACGKRDQSKFTPVRLCKFTPAGLLPSHVDLLQQVSNPETPGAATAGSTTFKLPALMSSAAKKKCREAKCV